MKQTILDKIRRAAGMLLLVAVGASGLYSCKDDDEANAQRQLGNSEVQLFSSTVHSLAFTWKSVSNTSQYGYALKDAEGNIVEGGTTAGTSASFSDLDDGTPYTFEVWAYGAYGSRYTTSEKVTLAVSTPAIVQLDTPQPAASSENGVTVISWEAIEHADSYSYYLKLKDSSDTLEIATLADPKINMTGLEGTYEFGVMATSEDEAYSESEWGTIDFEVQKYELWSVAGTYSCTVSGTAYTWTDTLIAYSNGTYTLKAWWGREGYDLEFSVNSDGTMNLLNAGEINSYGYYPLPAYDGYTEYIYGSTDYSSYLPTFSGSETSGSISMYTYNGWETFTWPKATTVKPIDKLVGTYTESNTGYYYSSSWTALSSHASVTVSKKDDNTIILSDIANWDGVSLEGTVDFDAKTITFAPQTVATWYTFAGIGGQATSVVATFTDTQIVISNWSIWYSNYSYVKDYDSAGTWGGAGGVTTLTKQ